jgi:uncharacterized protein YciI
MHFLLMYDYVPDILELRGPFRQEHLRLAWEAHDRGELLIGGAFADPVDGALLLFDTENSNTVKSFAENDPYVKNGLVTDWRVRAWTTVIGDDAKTPIRP